MAMYSYDQVLADVSQVYEQLTGLPAPKIDLKNPRFPLPKGVDPVALVQSEIDYLNLYLLNSGVSTRLAKVPTWTPPAEIYETSQEYAINVELAGIDKEEVAIDQLNNILIVRGQRRFRRASEEAQYHSSERVYGMFERLFPLPNMVEPESLQTSMADGILEIKFLKRDAASTPSQAKKASAKKSS